MKKIKTLELRDKTLSELKKMAQDTTLELTSLRLQAKAGKPRTQSVARLADQLARILTIVRQKELGL